MKNAVFEKISSFGIVPVIAVEDVSAALPLADALAAGGLPVVEITFRTPAAAEVIAAISKARPDMLVGAGTVLSPETMKIAKEAGASFAVAPGLNPRVVEAAKDIGLPFVPGVCTPSEIEQGIEFGLELLKFFPAEPMGGVKFLSSIYAPYKHTGVKFMVTGGINAEGAADWLACPAVAAVGGSWMAKAKDISAGNWHAIEENCRAAAALRAR